MTLLQQLMKFLNLPDNSDTFMPKFCLDTATTMILNYTKLDNLDVRFDNAIVMLAAYVYNSNLSIIKNYREGERSIEFFDNTSDIPPQIRAMLPYPKIKVL